MSNKQLLNEDGLSHWDRQNSLYLEEVCGLQSCGVSQKVEKWFPLRTASMRGAGENRKQGGPRASTEARVTSSITSAFNPHLFAILMSFKKIYKTEVRLRVSLGAARPLCTVRMS